MLNLLVLRCKNIENTKEFYEKHLGFKFVLEQHGSSPLHYSTTICSNDNTMVLELYPVKMNSEPDQTRLGFNLNQLNETSYQVIKDPDGRSVELHFNFVKKVA